MTGLGQRSASAVLWGAGGSFARVALQFVIQVVLARILGPEQYGLFAIGVIVVNFGTFFSDIGLAFGLVQKEQVSDADVRFVVTWQIMVGVFLAISIALGSGYLAMLLGDSRAEDVIFALAWICFLNALIAPSLNLLKRRLDFRLIQMSQLGAYVIGYVAVGLPMALAGWQVWSLVWAWLVQTLVTLTLFYLGVRHPLKPLFWYAEAATQFRYSVVVLATNLMNWIINSVDRVVVSHTFGSRDIGLYATSYNVLSTPAGTLLSIFQPVFFSAASRIGGEDGRIFAAHRALVSAVALFVLPAFVSIALVADTFILALYGADWQDAADLLRPIALGMPFYMAWGLTTPLLWASGRPQLEVISQVPIAIAWGMAAWAAAQLSVLAVAWAVLGLFLVRSITIFLYASKTMGLDLSALWRSVRGGLLITFPCGGLVWLADLGARKTWMTPQAWLGMDILVGVVSLLGAIYVLPAVVPEELCHRIDQVCNRLPTSMRLFAKSIFGRKSVRQ